MNFSFKLQQLILLLIIPILSGQIIFQGWLVYTQKKASVITGIDTTLLTVSDVLGSFLHGNGHEELLQPKTTRSIAPGSADYAMAIDGHSGDLMWVNLNNGEGTRISFDNLPPIKSVAASGEEQVYFGLAEDSQTLYRINLSDFGNPDTQLLGSLSQPAKGIFFNRKTQSLCGFGETVFSIAVADGTSGGTLGTQRLFGLEDIQARTVLYHAARDQYLILNQSSGQVRLVNSDGRLVEQLEILPAGDQEPLEIAALLSHPNTQKVYAAGSVLGTLDLVTGTYDTEGMVQHYYSTEGAFYQKVRRPMVRIKEQLDLTYLYTQHVSTDRAIIYGVDATDMQSDDFTPPGYTEKISEQEFDKFQKLISHGQTLVTDIEYWENWGYLKSSHTPIYNLENQIVAMTGTDLSADSVYIETRKSTYSSMLIGAGCLILASFVSYLISLRLTKQVAAMKDNALLLAAGNYAHRIPTNGARELSTLSKRMNSLANTLESQSNSTQLIQKRLKTFSDNQYLDHLLNETSLTTQFNQSGTFQIKYPNQTHSSDLITGHRAYRQYCVVWCFRAGNRIPHDAHLQLQIGILLDKIFEDSAINWAQIKAQFLVFENELTDLNFFMIDTKKNTLQSYLTEGFSIELHSPKNGMDRALVHVAQSLPLDLQTLRFMKTPASHGTHQAVLEILTRKEPNDA